MPQAVRFGAGRELRLGDSTTREVDPTIPGVPVTPTLKPEQLPDAQA